MRNHFALRPYRFQAEPWDEKMSYSRAMPHRHNAAGAVFRVLSAFPIAALSLTVVTDVAYWQTANLLWLHFSEWLLFAGVVFAVLAAIVRLLEAVFERNWRSWLYYAAGLAVIVLAGLNNFIHTADGLTAVVPYGLTVSVLTVIAMCMTGFFGKIGGSHV